MRLIDAAMADCILYEKQSVSDGEGGFEVMWKEGASFRAAITFNTSIEAKTAQIQGVTSLYTVTTKKSAKLDYHDVFKRLSDGKIFRVTSDGDDVVSPASSTLDMRQISAEEWRLA